MTPPSNCGSPAYSFDISPDSKILASTVSSQIYLWSLDSGQPIGSLICVDGDYGLNVLVHELGHAFGLPHDFRSDTYFMSYGSQPNQFSEAAAERLDAHRHFNTNQTYFSIPPTIEMLKPRMALSGNIHPHFKITDPDGLHQA